MEHASARWVNHSILHHTLDARWMDIERKSSLLALQVYRFGKHHAQQMQCYLPDYSVARENWRCFDAKYRIVARFCHQTEEYVCAASTDRELAEAQWHALSDADSKILDWSAIRELGSMHGKEAKRYVLQKLEAWCIERAASNAEDSAWSVAYAGVSDKPEDYLSSLRALESALGMSLDHSRVCLLAHIVFSNDTSVFLCETHMFVAQAGGTEIPALCQRIAYHSIVAIDAVVRGNDSSAPVESLCVHVTTPHTQETRTRLRFEHPSRKLCERFRSTLLYLWSTQCDMLLDGDAVYIDHYRTDALDVYIPIEQLFTRTHRLLAFNQRIYANCDRLRIDDIASIAIESHKRTRSAALPHECYYRQTLQTKSGKKYFSVGWQDGSDVDHYCLSLYDSDVAVFSDRLSSKSIALRGYEFRENALWSMCGIEFELPERLKKSNAELLQSSRRDAYYFCAEPKAHEHIALFDSAALNESTQRALIRAWKAARPTCSFVSGSALTKQDSLCGCVVHRNSKLRELVYERGTPHSLSVYFWLCWSDSAARVTLPDAYYARATELDVENITRQVAADVPRTFPNIPFISAPESQQRLTRLLCAYAIRNPSVGYAQGMNFVVAVLFMLSNGDERASFALLCALCEDLLVGYYSARGMLGMRADIDFVVQSINERMPHIPRLLASLSQVTTVETLCFGWLPKLFVGTLRMREVLRVLDIVFYERSKLILLKLCIAMFACMHTQISECRSDVEFHTRIGEMTPRLDTLLEYCLSDEMQWLTQHEYESRVRRHIQSRALALRSKTQPHVHKQRTSHQDELSKLFSGSGVDVAYQATAETRLLPPSEEIFWKSDT